MGSSSFERRANPRVSVALLCYGPTNSRIAIARTVNISREGVLLAWRTTAAAAAPSLGDSLTVDLALPASRLVQRCIRCRGRVVRVQLAEGEDALVAVAITQMEFCDREPAEKARRAGAGVEEAGQ